MTKGLISRRELMMLAAIGAVSQLFSPVQRHAYGLSNDSAIPATDSLERKVFLPQKVTSVLPLSVGAQTFMMIGDPNKLASVATEVSNDSDDYCDAGLDRILALPIRDRKAVKESALSSAQARIQRPDCLLDAGIPYDGLAEELDCLEQATGIPCMFIDLSFGKIQESFKLVQDNLFSRERVSEIVSIFDHSRELAVGTERIQTQKRVFYAPKANGMAARKGIGVQLDALRLLGLHFFEEPYDYRNEVVQIEIVDNLNPDLVLFDDCEMLDQLLSCSGEGYEQWKGIEAIAQSRFVVSPALIHSWWGSPILVQCLGILWLTWVLSPEACSFDLIEEAVACYEILFHLRRDNETMQATVGEYDLAGL